MSPQPWQPANNGIGPRRWFVCRQLSEGSLSLDYHERADGHVIRFASMEAAQRRADRLNAGEAA